MVEVLRDKTGYDVKLKDCRYEKHCGLEKLCYRNWDVEDDCNDYEVVSFNYGSTVYFDVYEPVFDDDGYAGMKKNSERIYPVFEEKKEEEKPETVEDKPAEEVENYGTFSDFDELALFCECKNFTNEEMAEELNYILYEDIDLATEYFDTLHPFDKEMLYAFYIAAKEGFNSKWKLDDDAPLGIFCDEGKIFLAYSEESEEF